MATNGFATPLRLYSLSCLVGDPAASAAARAPSGGADHLLAALIDAHRAGWLVRLLVGIQQVFPNRHERGAGLGRVTRITKPAPEFMSNNAAA